MHRKSFLLAYPMNNIMTKPAITVDYGDETRHWFYIDEVITELETTCAKFNDLIYCRRFTFKANLKYIKNTDEYIA